MRCPNCGSELTYDAQFCANCGEKIMKNYESGYGNSNSGGYMSQHNYNGTGRYNGNYNYKPQYSQNNNQGYGGRKPEYGQKPPGSSGALIAIVCVLVALIIAGVIGVGILAIGSIQDEIDRDKEKIVDIYKVSEDKNDENIEEEQEETEVVKTQKPTPKPTQTPTPTPEEVPVVVQTVTPKPADSKKQYYSEEARAIEAYSNSLDYDNMPQQEYNIATGDVFEKWDDLLNDVYKYLKQTMPKGEFEKLEKDEVAWIKEKEAAIESESASWRGGSAEAGIKHGVGIRYTKERCYYLISLIDD